MSLPFAVVNIDNTKWTVKYLPNGTVKLVYQSGSVMIIR